MDKYTFVALPEKHILEKLNAVRTYLYTNGYRYSTILPKNNVHITLAQAGLPPETNLNLLRKDLQTELAEVTSFEVEYDYITDKINPANEKYPQGSAWIALHFQNDNLRDLTIKIDTYLLSKGMSETKDYVKELGLNPEINLYSQIADHMNLCNYARVDRMEEARKYISENVSNKFAITTIALRDSVGNQVWEFDLKW